jgi:glycosyltransferase involved in cell wall biosynthesis
MAKDKTLNILYITQLFPPEPGATIRPLEQGVHLKECGHTVTVLTTFPYYTRGVLNKEHHSVLLHEEEMCGLRVIRIWSYWAKRRGRLRRAWSFLTFAVAGVLFSAFSSRIAYQDVVIASSPYPLTELAGLMLARLWRAKFVLELRDHPTATLAGAGFRKGSWTFRLLMGYYAAVSRRADVVAVPYHGLARYLTSTVGLSSCDCLVVPHGVDGRRFVGADGARAREQLLLGDAFIFLYCGSFSSIYRIPDIVDSAQSLMDVKRIRLVLIGDGADRPHVERLIQEYQLHNVTLIPARPPDEMGDLLAAADVFIASGSQAASFESDCWDRTTKICDYLFFHKPIIAVEDQPRMGNFLESVGAGMWVSAASPAETAAVMRRIAENSLLRDKLAMNARRFAEGGLPRSVTMRHLVKRLEEWQRARNTCSLEGN